MTYDEALADRVRDVLTTLRADRDPATERRMFGGLAFLAEGRMAVAVSGAGGLMARVDPDAAPTLLEQDGVAPVEMRGRPTRGWLRVAADLLTTEDDLRRWVAVGLEAARAAG